MICYIGIDPGANTGFAMITGPESVITADNKEDIFSLLDGLRSAHFVIGLEKVHAVWGSAAKATFSFGSNYGFWVGILEYLGFKYTDVTAKEWQDSMMEKPPRPPVAGLTQYQARKIKSLHKDLIKLESCKAASAAFPKAHLSNHNVCDSVNIARYLRYIYKEKKHGKEKES
jgi:hypothetical protein